MKKKTLRIKSERLGELTNEELVRVAGGASTVTKLCLTGTETYECPTLPVNNCIGVS